MAASPPASEVSGPQAFVVMGVSGCGKSSVGQAIGDRLGLAFIEGDALHPQANVEKMSRGVPLTDEDRFPWLDLIGAEIQASLARGEGIVVSCSSLRRIYRDRLRRYAGGRLTFVFLKGSEALLTGRMAARKGHFMPLSLLQSQLATLEDPSEEEGVLTIGIEGSSAEVIELALEGLAKRAR